MITFMYAVLFIVWIMAVVEGVREGVIREFGKNNAIYTCFCLGPLGFALVCLSKKLEE